MGGMAIVEVYDLACHNIMARTAKDLEHLVKHTMFC